MEILGQILAKYEVSKLDLGLFLAISANCEVSRLNLKAFSAYFGALLDHSKAFSAYFGA